MIEQTDVIFWVTLSGLLLLASSRLRQSLRKVSFKVVGFITKPAYTYQQDGSVFVYHGVFTNRQNPYSHPVNFAFEQIAQNRFGAWTFTGNCVMLDTMLDEQL